jgi:AcrR family transcriptional regulator
MSQPDLPQPRKRPKQSRSQMLVQAIQQACLQILRRDGPDQLTTQRIAEAAGINIASLYQYYPNKDAILADVFEEQIRQYTESGRERIAQIRQLSQQSFEGTLRAIVDMEVEQRLLLYRMDPEFYRLYHHSFDIHRRINELTLSLDNPGWDEWFPRFLAYHRAELRSEDLQTLSRMASHALTGVLLSTVAQDPTLLESGQFKRELFLLLYTYLSGRPPE